DPAAAAVGADVVFGEGHMVGDPAGVDAAAVGDVGKFCEKRARVDGKDAVCGDAEVDRDGHPLSRAAVGVAEEAAVGLSLAYSRQATSLPLTSKNGISPWRHSSMT